MDFVLANFLHISYHAELPLRISIFYHILLAICIYWLALIYFPEAVTGGVLSEKVFLEISQKSQENNCAGVLGLQLYLKRDSDRVVFL